MGLTLVTAAAEEALTLAEAQDFLRVDGADDGAVLASVLAAARQQLDGKQSWLGRALLTQTWDYTLDLFPGGWDRPLDSWLRAMAIRVPLPPLQSVTYVKYVDYGGALQTMPSTDYVVIKSEEPALIVPAYGRWWPPTREQLEAVTVRFVAGHGDTAQDVPEAIRLGLKALTAYYYEHRGDAVVEVPRHVERVLDNWR